MDFDTLLIQFGLPAEDTLRSLGWTFGAMLLAATLGWLASTYASAPLAKLLLRATGRPAADPLLLPAQLRDVVTALLLLVFRAMVPLNTLTATIIAAMLAVVCALVVYRALRWAAAGPSLATSAAIFTFTLVLTGALGGLDQMIASLDSIGVTFGTRRFSLLSDISLAIVVAILYFGAQLLNRVAVHSIEQTALDPAQQLLAQKLIGIAIIVACFLVAIDAAGIDLTALKVFSGAVGLAIGFGLQKTFGNLIAGVILLMDRSIKPGDVIVVGNTFGSVNKIGVRAVSVVTRDGKEHLIPNENLMTQEVENWSYSSREVRIHIPVGVGYGANIKVAQRLMAEAASVSARVLPDPPPTVWLKGFGDNSVDHEILVWIADPEAGTSNVQSEILNRLWDLFAENGIEIPFPQRDIHIRSLPKT